MGQTTQESGYAKRLTRWLPVDMGNYPYVTARVRAKKASLLPKGTYDRLLRMSIPEIARLLGEGQYAEEMRELGTRYEGVDLVEMATRNNLAKVFSQIIGFAEGPLREMIAAYLARWDVWNVKTLLRGLFYGATQTEVEEDLIPAGSFSRDFLEDLARRESLEEVVEALDSTPYGYVLLGLPTRAEELTSLAPFEDALDKAFYENLLAAIPPASEPTRLFHNFVRKEVDVTNLQTLLRLRGIQGLPPRTLFIRGGLFRPPQVLKEMVDLEWPALLEALRGAPFYDAVAPYLQEESPRVADGIRALEKWHLAQAATGANLHPLSVLPVLDYIVSKTTEVENLRIIVRGKATHLEESTIREMLVI